MTERHFEQMTWRQGALIGQGLCGACGALWPCWQERDHLALKDVIDEQESGQGRLV